VEFAYAELEANVKDKVEKYWLMDGQAHDAIVIKIEPITSVTTPPATPTCMTVCMIKGFNSAQFALTLSDSFYS